MNPETAKILAGLLQLQEDIIAELEIDIEKSGADPHSFLFDADKYNQFIENYYSITNLKKSKDD